MRDIGLWGNGRNVEVMAVVGLISYVNIALLNRTEPSLRDAALPLEVYLQFRI
jgi:hypothetical protein